MAIQGVFLSDSHITGNRKGDFASSLIQVMPEGNAPLLALSSGMPSRDAQDVIVTWFEENHITGRADITAFVTDGDGTGYVVDDASSYAPGTVMMNERTGEYVLVTASVPSTNTITVTRDLAGEGATTMLLTDFLQRVGTAFEEASNRPIGIVNMGFVRLNFLQIFRNAWDVSGTAQAVAYYTSAPPAKNKADAGFFHAEDIERSFLWGKKAIGTLNGRPFRMADGIYNMIQTNVTPAGATTDYGDMDAFFQTIFSKNIKGKPNERIAFTGNKTLGILNEIALANSQMNLQPGATEFGMNVHRWITPYGTVMLKTHPLFTESPFRTGELMVLHPGAVETRYLRRTFIDNYDQNGTRAGVDADYGVYTTEMTFEYHAEVTAGLMTGFTAAA